MLKPRGPSLNDLLAIMLPKERKRWDRDNLPEKDREKLIQAVRYRWNAGERPSAVRKLEEVAKEAADRMRRKSEEDETTDALKRRIEASPELRKIVLGSQIASNTFQHASNPKPPKRSASENKAAERLLEFVTDANTGKTQMVLRADESPPPHTNPSEFFRPNRGWFLGGAGFVAAYIIDQIKAPLWLALATLFVLLGCALVWPWIEKSHLRRRIFWLSMILYAIMVLLVVVLTRGASSQGNSLSTPAQPTPQLQKSDERTFADVDAVYLVGLYQKYNSAQADELVKSYIGKWTTISGTVDDVVRGGVDNGAMTVSVKRTDGGFLYAVVADFNEQRWTDRALLFRRGENVTIKGKIDHIMSGGILLMKCEIVE